ncbi:MAG: DUF1761 domain-containing protein [Rectinemataceae bacterium]|nr:DUF1761 domain-containing protein [Rectinemataceae bacterium]
MEVEINYLAVLVATAAAIILGTAWYGPLFGKQWMRIVSVSMGEMTPAAKRSMMRSYAILALTTFVMAFVLAHALSFASQITEAEGVLASVTTAIWVWLGFIAPVTLSSVLWENRPWKYWFITSGYYLVSLILMSVILTVWA